MTALRTLARRRRLALLAAAAAIGASVLAGVEFSTASAATVNVQQSTSANWAGYVDTGKTFSSVSGSWVVPSASSSTQGYSAFWVGLGGAGGTSSGLEQVGTESDYAGGQARYTAWYELLPSAPVTLNLSIHPGDHVSATTSVSGTKVTVSFADLTTGKSVTKTLHMSRPDTSSAEWIAEAPALQAANGGSSVLPLADFGKVTFTKASATAGGHTGSITDSHWKAMQVNLESSGGGFGGPGGGFAARRGLTSAGASAGATTSSLNSTGSSFSVSWSSGSTTAGGYGDGPGPWGFGAR